MGTEELLMDFAAVADQNGVLSRDAFDSVVRTPLDSKRPRFAPIGGPKEASLCTERQSKEASSRATQHGAHYYSHRLPHHREATLCTDGRSQRRPPYLQCVMG